MWHEARKQERKIRGMLVDYRRRAERRRDFYEKIKADPTQFLQVHGRQCKIHLDPAVAAAAEGPATMMPWQGQTENLIDRFDVRAHLDFIPPILNLEDEDASYEERQINYERYRIIAQNSFLAITEEKFLKQLHLEEQFGYTENEPKKKKTGGAAIGFNYEDGTGTSQPMPSANQEESSDEVSDSDLDVDLSINVSKIDQTQAHEMNRHGRSFGMSSNDFYSFLTHDLEEAETFRLAKEEEHEKALFSGRKSRRERRAHREKRLANRKISPPSYAAKESPTLVVHEKSESRSPSPEVTGKITFITSFGEEEEPQMPLKPTYADKVKFGNRLKKLRAGSEERSVYRDGNNVSSPSNEKVFFRKRPYNNSRDRSIHSKSKDLRKRIRSRRSSSSSPSRSRSRSRNRRSRSSSRSRSRRFKKSTSKSRSNRSVSRSKSRSASKNISRSRSKNRSISRSISKSVSRSRSRSKSKSRSKKSYSSSSSSSSSGPSENDLPPKAVPRYYGRKKSDQSSSEIGDSDEDDTNKPAPSSVPNINLKTGKSGTSTKILPTISASANSSLQERLKRKRQALLNKQFKADKIAEQIKTEREKQEQQTREDELRDMALKLRRKQREKRHAYDSENSDSSSNSDTKTNPSTGEPKKSRSNSPKLRENKDRHKSQDYAYRDDDYNMRNNSRERNDRYSRRSPKARYDDKRGEDARNDDKRNNERRNDDRRNDERRNDERRNDERRNDDRRNDDRRNDDRRCDDRRNDDRRSDDRRNDDRRCVNNRNDDKSDDRDRVYNRDDRRRDDRRENRDRRDYNRDRIGGAGKSLVDY